MLTFYDAPISGNTYKVRLLLGQLAIPHEAARLDIAGGAVRAPDFRKVNPFGRVPFIVEDGSRGMQGLNVRIARALNRRMQRRGSVFDDHYHSRLLGSPTELVNAIADVLGNHAHHFGGVPSARDPFCSSAYDLARRQAVLSRPRTWLLCHGWRRARRIPRWVEFPDGGTADPRTSVTVT